MDGNQADPVSLETKLSHSGGELSPHFSGTPWHRPYLGADLWTESLASCEEQCQGTE